MSKTEEKVTNTNPPVATRWKPGQSGNPKGKPKGTKHLSTHIQEMLNDPKFEAMLLDSQKGVIQYKGAPIKAIIAVAIQKALNDKEKGQQWAEWLAKHGYGSNLNINVSVNPAREILEAAGLLEAEDDGQTTGDPKGSPTGQA